MRRFLGPILVGLGAFLLVAGLLLKFYAYPRVAVAPIDQNSVTKLSATGAEIFDSGALKPLQTDLTAENRTVGDVKASKEAGDDVRVWVGTTSIRSADGTVRSRSTERVPFDASTAEAVNCCGAFDETTDGERTQVKRKGLVWKFPFGTEKKSYQVWDGTLGDTATAKFVKESSVKGLSTYQFRSEVPRTEVGTRDIPGSLVGSSEASVTAASMYAATTTYEIEPKTGAIVTQTIDQDSTLAVDGEDVITTTKAELSYTDATVSANVEEFTTKSSQLTLVGTTLPLITIILGLILIVAGVVLGRRKV